MAVWAVTISYAFVSFGFLVDAGCCHDEHGQNPATPGCHHHVPTKVFSAVHALAHFSLLDISPLLTKKTCCMSRGEPAPNAARHPLVITCRSAKTPELPRNSIPLSVVSFWTNAQVRLFAVVCGFASTPSIHHSTHSTVLLI